MILTLFLHAPVGTACQMLFLTYHYIQIAKKNTKPTLVGTNDAFTRNRKIAERCNFALIMFTIDKLLLFCILKPTTIRRFFSKTQIRCLCQTDWYSTKTCLIITWWLKYPLNDEKIDWRNIDDNWIVFYIFSIFLLWQSYNTS